LVLRNALMPESRQPHNRVINRSCCERTLLAVALGPNNHQLTPTLSPSYPDSEMVDDDDEIQSEDEIHTHLTNGGPSHFQMDEAFCARMRRAIEAGLESAPIGVITTPGTKNPKYVPTKHPRPLVSPLVDMDV
jgi:hypothetical protein